MFKTNKSELIDVIMNPEFCKRNFIKNFKPEIYTREDLVNSLHELIELINNTPNHVDIKIPQNLGPSIYDLMKRLYAAGSHISEKLDVSYDGTVRDGRGFVYAGWAQKSFNLGDNLPKKYSNKIYALTQKICDHPPRIMLSRVDTKDPKQEHYYYFNSVEDDNSNKCYKCFNILENDANYPRLYSFYHYIYEFLSKEPEDFGIINLRYPLNSKEHDLLVELENLPMGTLIDTENKLVVKSAPVGAFNYVELYNGAIDL